MRYGWSDWRAYPLLMAQTGDSDRISSLTWGSSRASVLFGTRSFLDVHPLVSGLQHFVRRHATVRPADAEAGADPHGPSLGTDRLDDLAAQTYGEVGGVGLAEPVGEDHELVAAEPGHGVAVAHALGQPPGDLDEHRVTRVVPEPVVDRLEAVEVAEEHREPLGAVVALPLGGDGVHMVVEGVERLLAAGPEVETVAVRVEGRVAEGRVDRLQRGARVGGALLTEPGGQPRAQLGGVRQAGQGVVGGTVGELELAALALLDVLDVGEQEARPVGGVGDHRVAQGHPEVRAVPAPEAELRAPAFRRGPQQGAYVLGVDQVGEGVAAHSGRGAAQEAAQGVVGAQDPAVLIAAHLGDGHAGGGVLEGLPKALFTGSESLLLPFEPDQCTLHVR